MAVNAILVETMRNISTRMTPITRPAISVYPISASAVKFVSSSDMPGHVRPGQAQTSPKLEPDSANTYNQGRARVRSVAGTAPAEIPCALNMIA